jgi:hypothetical protein
MQAPSLVRTRLAATRNERPLFAGSAGVQLEADGVMARVRVSSRVAAPDLEAAALRLFERVTVGLGAVPVEVSSGSHLRAV